MKFGWSARAKSVSFLMFWDVSTITIDSESFVVENDFICFCNDFLWVWSRDGVCFEI